MARLVHLRTFGRNGRGGENMADPDPFLASLGVTPGEQAAYDAYCDAVADAAEEEAKHLDRKLTLQDVFDTAHEQALNALRAHKAAEGGLPCSR